MMINIYSGHETLYAGEPRGKDSESVAKNSEATLDILFWEAFTDKHSPKALLLFFFFFFSFLFPPCVIF